MNFLDAVNSTSEMAGSLVAALVGAHPETFSGDVYFAPRIGVDHAVQWRGEDIPAWLGTLLHGSASALPLPKAANDGPVDMRKNPLDSLSAFSERVEPGAARRALAHSRCGKEAIGGRLVTGTFQELGVFSRPDLGESPLPEHVAERRHAEVRKLIQAQLESGLGTQPTGTALDGVIRMERP